MKNYSIYNLYWFTGQAGAGKTELARMLKTQLDQFYKKFVIIDGDDIRELYKNADYSKEGRIANVDLVQKLCVFLIKNDITPIVCMVSPFAEQRRSFVESNNGIEIYVHCDEIRGREHYHVSYYEKPEVNTVSISIDTTNKSVNQSFEELWKILS
jgi:adenylylsulfate kinase-like enzyme